MDTFFSLDLFVALLEILTISVAEDALSRQFSNGIREEFKSLQLMMVHSRYSNSFRQL